MSSESQRCGSPFFSGNMCSTLQHGNCDKNNCNTWGHKSDAVKIMNFFIKRKCNSSCTKVSFFSVSSAVNWVLFKPEINWKPFFRVLCAERALARTVNTWQNTVNYSEHSQITSQTAEENLMKSLHSFYAIKQNKKTFLRLFKFPSWLLQSKNMLRDFFSALSSWNEC